MRRRHPSPEDPAHEAARPSRSRRSFLGLLSAAGTATVAGAAGVVSTPQRAAAEARARLVGWRCCNLVYSPNCPSSGGSYHCTRGTMRVWYCCQGGRTYACGECTSGGDCYSGSFYCSAGWTVAPNNCTIGRLSPTSFEPRVDAAELAQMRAGTYPPAPDPDFVDANPHLFTFDKARSNA